MASSGRRGRREKTSVRKKFERVGESGVRLFCGSMGGTGRELQEWEKREKREEGGKIFPAGRKNKKAAKGTF